MEAAENSVQFLHVGDSHGCLDRVDKSDMTAGRNHDEAFALDYIACGMFVGMEVLDEFAASLRLGKVIVIVDQSAAAYRLEGNAVDIARRERSLQRMRMVAADWGDMLGDQRRSIELTPGLRFLSFLLQTFFAEHIFTADIKREITPHPGTVLQHKSVEPTEMIPVAVAQDQPVDFRGIDSKQVEVAIQNFRGVAEVEKILPGATVLRDSRCSERPHSQARVDI